MTIEPYTPPPDDDPDPEVPGSGEWPSFLSVAFIAILVGVVLFIFAEFA